MRPGSSWKVRLVANGAWVEQAADAADVPDGRDAAEGQVVEVNEPARAFVASALAVAAVGLGWAYAPCFATLALDTATAGDWTMDCESDTYADHYAKAGYAKNAATMRDKVLGSMPRTMSISLNGRTVVRTTTI